MWGFFLPSLILNSGSSAVMQRRRPVGIKPAVTSKRHNTTSPSPLFHFKRVVKGLKLAPKTPSLLLAELSLWGWSILYDARAGDTTLEVSCPWVTSDRSRASNCLFAQFEITFYLVVIKSAKMLQDDHSGKTRITQTGQTNPNIRE